MNWFVITYDRTARQLVSIVEFPKHACEVAIEACFTGHKTKDPSVELKLVGARSVDSLRIGYPRFFADHPDAAPLPHTVANV